MERFKKEIVKEGSQAYDKIVQLKMTAEDGKNRITDTETILRLIQSIPSPKAEPFKQWLAQVGADRIAEIENPELAQAQPSLRGLIFLQKKQYKMTYYELEALLTPLSRGVGGVFLKSCYSEY